MSQTHGDEFLTKLETNYHFLKSLSLSRAYYTFWLDHQEKSKISPNCDFSLAQNHRDICNYSSVCTSFQNALARIRMMQLLRSPIDISKRCEYLTYWIYDNVMKNNESCDNNEQFYQKLNDLKKKYSTIHDICNIENFKIGNEEFNKKKKLYLLGETLNLIKKEYGNISNVLEPSYNQYFEECANIYNEIVSSDKCEINENSKEVLTEFKNNFDAAKLFLSQNGVNITHDLTEYSESVCQKQSQTVQIKGSRGEEEHDGVGAEEQDRGEPAAQEEGSEHVGAEQVGSLSGIHEQEAVSVVEAGSRTETEILQTAKEDSFNGEATIVPGINEDTSESFIPKNVSTIGATLAGSSLFLLMMYKYTPLGSWVNRKILKKDKLMDNMKKNEQELLLYGVVNRERDINDTMYNIRYNTISNR